MRYAIDSEGKRIKVTETGQRAFCPGCKDEVISKCGDVYVPHWSHKNYNICEHEPISEWHLMWQDCYPEEQREIVYKHERPEGKKFHKADIVTSDGLVIEVQHSPIKKEDIESREECYGNMIWVLDSETYKARPLYSDSLRVSDALLKNLKNIYDNSREIINEYFSDFDEFETTVKRSVSTKQFMLTTTGYRQQFFAYAKKPIIIDNKDKYKSLSYVHNKSEKYITDMHVTSKFDDDANLILVALSIDVHTGRTVKFISHEQFFNKYGGDYTKYEAVATQKATHQEIKLTRKKRFDKDAFNKIEYYYNKYKRSSNDQDKYKLITIMKEVGYTKKERSQTLAQAERFIKIMNPRMY